MPRFIVIVLDGLGVGALPDAQEFGDKGAFTLKHILDARGRLDIPNLVGLGLYNIDGLGLSPTAAPRGCFGKCAEKAKAKDTTNGHFELMGLQMEKPCRVFGEHFPPRIIQVLERLIGTEVIGNYPASGTEIIQVLGDEHTRTGKPIVYLSADSLMQIAMHEEVIPLERQYEICQIARGLMVGDDTVSRIICRPFLGGNGKYFRTENRKDFSIDPPGRTVLDVLKETGRDVIAVGKIEDIFNHKGITETNHTKNNPDGIAATIKYIKERAFNGLLFVNLVDFDMLYGHRNDPQGYGDALEYFDAHLPELLAALCGDDILVLTADHGCDPTMPGADHSREYIPVLAYGPKLAQGVNLGVRETFSDVAATVAAYFGETFPQGTSFLSELGVPAPT